MIKLLIVDDSALMRRRLLSLFQEAGGFEIRQARNGREAVEENRAFRPDVITLDINMPEMDGLTALSMIMTDRPVPVVMVSSLTERGALATLEALNLGAVDFVAKPGGTISLSIDDISAELVGKVRSAARARLAQGRPARAVLREGGKTPRSANAAASANAHASARTRAADGVVVIGVSTGGPRTLEDILPLLPADFPWPVLIAQHMPAAFTRSFADRLNKVCHLQVAEADGPLPLSPGCAYIARGGADMVVARRGGTLTALPRPECARQLWHPSVELLARSVLEHYPPQRIIGVMLTGMGDDGAEALADIRRRGGRTIAESEATAIVYGMPKELIDRDGASVVLPCDKIAAQLVAWAEG